MKNIKKGLINVTANILSAPAQYKAHRAIKQADKDVATIKRARSYDNSTSDAAVGARTAAYMVKKRLQK